MDKSAHEGLEGEVVAVDERLSTIDMRDDDDAITTTHFNSMNDFDSFDSKKIIAAGGIHCLVGLVLKIVDGKFKIMN